MKTIVEARKNSCRFVYLEDGITFYCNDDDSHDVMMKITEFYKQYNCVNLRTGEVFYLDEYTQVVPVEATLVVPF